MGAYYTELNLTMTEFSDAQLKAALKSSFGIQAHAAEKLGVTRGAVCQRMTPEIRAWVAELEETLIDAAEAGAAEAVLGKDKGMIKWTLANHPRAKARGWGQKIELGGPNGGPVQIGGKVHVTVSYVEAAKDPGDVI